MKITLETISPKLLPFLRLMNADKEVAHAKRVPNGYGRLRQRYSGLTNAEAMLIEIRSLIATWPGIN